MLARETSTRLCSMVDVPEVETLSNMIGELLFTRGSWELDSLSMVRHICWPQAKGISRATPERLIHQKFPDIDKSLDLEKIWKRNYPDFSLLILRNKISFLFLFSIFKIFKIFWKYFSFSVDFWANEETFLALLSIDEIPVNISLSPLVRNAKFRREKFNLQGNSKAGFWAKKAGLKQKIKVIW